MRVATFARHAHDSTQLDATDCPRCSVPPTMRGEWSAVRSGSAASRGQPGHRLWEVRRRRGASWCEPLQSADPIHAPSSGQQRVAVARRQLTKQPHLRSETMKTIFLAAAAALKSWRRFCLCWRWSRAVRRLRLPGLHLCGFRLRGGPDAGAEDPSGSDSAERPDGSHLRHPFAEPGCLVVPAQPDRRWQQLMSTRVKRGIAGASCPRRLCSGHRAVPLVDSVRWWAQ